MKLKLGAMVSLALGSTSAFAFTFNTFTTWGASDSSLGITGYTIEDFEDVNLVSGLQIAVTSTNGNFGPSSTLPNTFKPSDDLFGSAFSIGGGGAWDGTHGLINTRTNQTFSYTDSGSWGNVEFQVAAGTKSFGFSLQQVDHAGNVIWINGINVGTIGTLAPAFSTSGGQQGYLRIDAGVGETINSVRMTNVNGDGFMFDHVAFSTVPEPSSLLAIGLGGIFLGGRLRRRRA